MVETLKHKGVWLGAVVAALLVVIAFFSTQAFSSGLTATSEPLQNAGTDGVINYAQDWSAASAVITRHESTDLTVDGSDLVTDVAVQGTKSSGAVAVKLDLLDVSQTILDTKTWSLPSTSGTYNETFALTNGTTKLVGLAKVLATYTAASSVAIAFDAASSTNGKTTSLSWSHTVGAGGANRFLIVGVSLKSTSSVTNVTYGGQNMAYLGAQSSGANRVELWYKVAPLENANSVVVTLPSSLHAVGGATSWTEVHQTTPLGTIASATAVSTTPSVSVGSNTGDVVVDVLAHGGGVPTVDASQTQRWKLSQGGFRAAGSSEDGGATSTTMSWTASSGEWAIAGVALKQATP